MIRDRVSAGTSWLRSQPDRPFVILFAHICTVGLYLTGHAYSSVPFSDHRTRTLITSDLVPATHALAALVLLLAIIAGRWAAQAASLSFFVWTCTTIALFLGAHQRVPPLAYWSFVLSLVITLATFLMLVRWGVDGDERGGH